MNSPQSPTQQQGQGSEAGMWQQLLRSPHLLPCVAPVLVMVASRLDRAVATHCARVESSTGGSNSSSARGSSSSSSILQQQQPWRLWVPGSSSRSSSASTNTNGGGSGSSGGSVSGTSSDGGSGRNHSGGDVGHTVTACKLQLLQLLCLAPEVIDWAMQRMDINKMYSQLLHMALVACSACCAASIELPLSGYMGSGVPEEQQQLWQFEWQLWQVLPTVLLQCANSLLLPGAPHPTQAQGQGLVQQLLALCMKADKQSQQLHLILRTLRLPSEPLLPALPQECLGALLQVADRLLCQQSPANTAATGSTGSSSSSISSSFSTEARSLLAGQLLLLLFGVARDSQALCSEPSSDSHSHNAAATVPPLAASFAEYATALEAALRASSEVIYSGMISTRIRMEVSTAAINLCSVVLLPHQQTNSVLMQHMGLCGPVALAQEQEHLYSLLSTLQKLRCCVRGEGHWDLGEGVTASCCVAAGSTAVAMLKRALLPTGGFTAANQHSSSSAAAITSVAHLPSLVLFGRCLLQWAWKLQQQASELVLLGSGALQWEEHKKTLLGKHGAARVCLPGLRQGSSIKPEVRLESLAATVQEWVGGIDSLAQQQLTAAGCSPQQLQQQLDALLSAQQATQQGLTDASLAVLVQQLQATGAMLSGIAVPHFCNNPACTNLSGPTEVRLVSGRSCICAGCRIARYCGRACQRAAWKHHKPVCNALAPVALPTATAAGP
jgi:hypothetical protein